ncbi:hypothetical protein [Nitratireductor sp. ZSWI3]|uniref:hypothetical protein n=1 Tax=Nitratireductor sp. ZSWI3 TaxID=2966359 RepID=UPI00214FD8E5|nr:hypothetical protein [Nitratireductor sp. ZSWI3]MCR4265982.1 hypothetical protein [Nitratireductor sp. ZSWI3]
MIADYIDEFIMLCVALWMTGVGFGYLKMPVEGKPGQQAWWAHIIGHFKWLGPLLAVIAVVLAGASQR